MMFCASCGAAAPEGALFCPGCGTAVASASAVEAPLPAAPTAPAASPLIAASQLVISANKLEEFSPIQFEDPAGRPMGEARTLGSLPPVYTLYDEHGQVVLVVDTVRSQARELDWQVHDGAGEVLARLTLRPASWGREHGVRVESLGPQFGVTVGGQDALLLVLSATGTKAELFALRDGSVLASCTGSLSNRTVRSQIEIAKGADLDRRIVLGSFIAATVLSKGKGLRTTVRTPGARPPR